MDFMGQKFHKYSHFSVLQLIKFYHRTGFNFVGNVNIWFDFI